MCVSAIRQVMIEWPERRLGTSRSWTEQACRAGKLTPEIKPDTFARYISVIMAGPAVQAVSGATLPERKRTVAMFRQTMPFPMDEPS
jgi:hypothetical protein